MINTFNPFSIRGRALAAKQSRQGYLFIMGVNNLNTTRRLNQKIDTLDRQETRIPNFRKNPTYSSQIFACGVCNKERIYGHSLQLPVNDLVLITCEGSCKKNTMHKFVRIHRGREERTIA